MGASGSKKYTPKFEFISTKTGVRAVDVKSGKLKRIYYDHFGMLRYQLVEKDHDGNLEFSLVSNKHEAMVASKEPLFAPGDSVFVMNTRWVGEWSAFAANGDLQPGPISNHKLVDDEGRFKENLITGVHWRAVTKWHFLFFVKTYGITGPVIEFKAPKRAGESSDGFRLASKPKAAKPRSNEEEKVEEEEEGDEGGGREEKKNDGVGGSGGKSKDSALLAQNRQPAWMKLVNLERHAKRYDLQGLANSIFNFSSGLPYGVDDLGVTKPDTGLGGLGGAAGGALMEEDVRASSAHVLCFADAQGAGRRKLGRLFAKTMAVHALLEAGAKRRRNAAAALRKADAKERRRAERKRKAVVARQREKQRRQQAQLEAEEAEEAAAAAAAAEGAGGGGGGAAAGRGSAGGSLLTGRLSAGGSRGSAGGVFGRNSASGRASQGAAASSLSFSPSSPIDAHIAAEEVFGKEFGLLMAASVHRKRFRSARLENTGAGAASFRLAALLFQFGGKQAHFRRLKASQQQGKPASPASLAPGGLMFASALGLVQASWRVGLERGKVVEARSAGHEDLAPLAASLLQAQWRATAVQLAKRKGAAERKKAIVLAKHARLASVLQKAFRNSMVRRRLARARAEVAQQLLAFGAVKVQGKWRRFITLRLERIAAGEEPPGGYGSESDEDSDSDEDNGDAERGGKKSSLKMQAPSSPNKKKVTTTTKPGFAGMTSEEASQRLDMIKAGQRIQLEARAQDLKRRKLLSSSDALVEAKAMHEQAEREAFARRSDPRPVSVRVWAVKGLPLFSAGAGAGAAAGAGAGVTPLYTLAELQASDLFVVVTALPSPPPPEALVGFGTEGASDVPNLQKKQHVAMKNPEKAQRATAFSRPAKTVRAALASSKVGRGGGLEQKQKDVEGCVDVEFKQEVELSGPDFDGHSTLVFTLLRRPPKKSGLLSSGTIRDEFLGQATLKMHDLPDLWQHSGGGAANLDAGALGAGSGGGMVAHNGKGGQTRFAKQNGPVEKELPLAEYICRVWDGHGQKLKIERKDARGGGRIKLSFLRQDNEAIVGAWVDVETTPPKHAFVTGGSGGGGGGSDGGVSAKAAQAGKAKAAAAAAKQALKPREFVRRWVVLSNGLVSVQESPTCEPDLEVSVEALRSCRLVEGAKLHPVDTAAHKAEEGQGELCIYFDAQKASQESLRRGKGKGVGAAAGGVAEGTYGFGTGPKDAKASAAVSGAASGRGTLVLREDNNQEISEAECLLKFQRALEKALFTHSHGT